MFGKEFFRNTLLVFTKFGHDKRSKSERQRGKLMNECIIFQEYSKHFSEKFEFKLRKNQFVFIDNSVDD